MFVREIKLCLLTTLALILCGCSSTAPYAPPSPLPTVTWYVKHYGEVSSNETQSFLSYMMNRLAPDKAARIIILNADAPMAFTTGGEFILISKGLILSLKSEAELAFIIAHEIAHDVLGHTKTEIFLDPKNASADERREIEMDADLHALAMVMKGQYDPHSALGSLRHTYAAFPDLEFSSSYPDLSTRISKLSDLILKSRWTPPGTTSTRDFQRFFSLLASS